MDKKQAATAKRSFIIHKDLGEVVSCMTDEEAGILFKSIFHWHMEKSIPDVPKELRFLLQSMVQQFKRDEAKYVAICEKRSVAGKYGAKQKLAKAGKRKHKLASEADNDSDNDSDNDINTPLTPQRGDVSALQSEFLSRFNSATGKKHRVLDAKAAGQLKARLRDGFTLDEIITAAGNCSKDDYHRDTGLKHLTPEFITRADKLQKYLYARTERKSTL